MDDLQEEPPIVPAPDSRTLLDGYRDMRDAYIRMLPSRAVRGFVSWFVSLLVMAVIVTGIETYGEHVKNPETVETWQAFHSPDGRFTVQMPGEVKSTIQNQVTSQGTYAQHLVTHDTGKEMFVVTFADYPTEILGSASEVDMVEAAIANIRQEDSISLVYDKSVVSGAHSGREARCDNTEKRATVIVRVFAVKNRVYSVTYSTTIGYVNEANVDHFFQSFHLD